MPENHIKNFKEGGKGTGDVLNVPSARGSVVSFEKRTQIWYQ